MFDSKGVNARGVHCYYDSFVVMTDAKNSEQFYSVVRASRCPIHNTLLTVSVDEDTEARLSDGSRHVRLRCYCAMCDIAVSVDVITYRAFQKRNKHYMKWLTMDLLNWAGRCFMYKSGFGDKCSCPKDNFPLRTYISYPWVTLFEIEHLEFEFLSKSVSLECPACNLRTKRTLQPGTVFDAKVFEKLVGKLHGNWRRRISSVIERS